MIILVDYNINRQALLLSGTLVSEGWLDFVSLRLVTFKETFKEIGLLQNSSDKLVWDFAQNNRMLLLTANRNAFGKDSLELVMRQENTPNSFPIITISDPNRVNEYEYRKV